MQIPEPLILIGGVLAYLLIILCSGGFMVIGAMVYDDPAAAKKIPPKVLFGLILLLPVLATGALIAMLIAGISGNTELTLNIAKAPFVLYGSLLCIGMPLAFVFGIVAGVMSGGKQSPTDKIV